MYKCVILSFRPAIHIPTLMSWRAESQQPAHKIHCFSLSYFSSWFQPTFSMYSSSTVMYVSAPSNGADIIPKDVSNSQATVKFPQQRTLYTKEFVALCATINETIPCHLSITGYSLDLHPASWQKTLTSLIYTMQLPTLPHHLQHAQQLGLKTLYNIYRYSIRRNLNGGFPCNPNPPLVTYLLKTPSEVNCKYTHIKFKKVNKTNLKKTGQATSYDLTSRRIRATIVAMEKL